MGQLVVTIALSVMPCTSKAPTDVSLLVKALLKTPTALSHDGHYPREADANTEIERRQTMTTRLVIITALLMLCAAATEAADVSGNWAVTITTADGKITGKASLELIGDKVTGQIGPSEDATIPIEGVLTAQTLTLKANPRPGRTAAFDSCELTVGDDKMIGTIQGGDAGKGTIEFVRITP